LNLALKSDDFLENPASLAAERNEDRPARDERKPVCLGGRARNFVMSDPDDKIHVIPLGADWEIETQSGTPLAHEGSKEEAVTAACEIAKEEGVATVIVHDGDGVTEAVHPVPASSELSSISPEEEP